MTALPEIERYRRAILALPPGPVRLDDVRSRAFLRLQDTRLAIYYAPFDYVNTNARIALVGVTPGPTQIVESFETVRDVLAAGGSADEALGAVKDRASFKGMRHELGRWLDELGIAQRLGLDSADELFHDSHRGLLHTTSAVRYPTFVRNRDGRWRNYDGSRPDFFAHAGLSRFVTSMLATELRALGSALIVPFGKANRAVEHLCRNSVVQRKQCLIGLPHPSPASPFRERYFQQAKPELLAQARRVSGGPDPVARPGGEATKADPQTPTPEGIIVIELTQGNLNNHHVYLRAHLDFFPADSVGGPSRQDGEGRPLTVHFSGLPEPVETDIAGGNKLFFRARGPWAEFFRRHGLRAGDHVVIERLATDEYLVRPDH